jgi:hypothetical protein
MSRLNNWLLSLVSVFHAAKDEDLKWKQQNQPQQQQLKAAQILAEKRLEAELKKRTVQLAYEIDLLNTENAAQLLILKIKYQQEIKDYKQYLHSLESLKISIQKSYAHLPEAVAFTIHHHAKQLLNQMWEAENFQDKMQLEMQLIQFMTTVHEESRLFLEGERMDNLPEKTLALIRSKSD